jgi:AcrR family transcriptional regulator
MPSDAAARPRDAQATRERLLAAAGDEFAQHGLAGARIDRIADRAEANKRLIYVYFGNKDDLFDAVLGARLGALTDAVPFDAADLPAYAGAVFDQVVTDPQVLALTTWRNLERGTATDAERASYRAKVKAVTAAQKAGQVTDAIPAVDLMAMIMSLLTSWLGAAPALKELGGTDPLGPRRLKQHRKALVEAIARLVAPSTVRGR